MARRLGPWGLLGALALLALAVLGWGSWRLADSLGLSGNGQEFSILRWELQNAPTKWLQAARELVSGGASGAEEDQLVAAYFTLVDEAQVLEKQITAAGPTDRAALEERLAQLRRQQEALENRVERILEGRLTSVLADVGLASSLPIFTEIEVVWPPVDFDFGLPPRVLVVSPRDRVFLLDEELLVGNLTEAQVAALEASVAERGLSGLVEEIGGVATYPSNVSPERSYRSALVTIAHEWVHHYLFFKPLGFRYFLNPDLRTLNETLANIVGGELADLLEQHYPLPAAVPSDLPPSAASAGFDFRQVMHNLRLRVDQLLAQGRITEAEALMEGTRRYLAENGVFIRKINQAYFAFHGTYADTPASTSPIGPKMQEVRQRVPSLAEFVRLMASVTSEGELDELLAELRARAGAG